MTRKRRHVRLARCRDPTSLTSGAALAATERSDVQASEPVSRGSQEDGLRPVVGAARCHLDYPLPLDQELSLRIHASTGVRHASANQFQTAKARDEDWRLSRHFPSSARRKLVWSRDIVHIHGGLSQSTVRG